jgi:glyoxylase-like metal-dependent hydrolase (beta-lactamase superfamily II)
MTAMMPDGAVTTREDLPIPEPGQVVEVAPGILWLQMPLPLALNHVNLWALDDGDGWVLVDTGMSTDTIKQLWRDLLAGPLGGKPVKRIIATHFHPDHAGLTGFLSDLTGAPVSMHPAEWERCRWVSTRSAAHFVEGQGSLFRQHGTPDETLAALAERGNVFRHRVDPIVDRIAPLEGDEGLNIGGRTWQVRLGSGHSPAHCCLWQADERILIAGDQILPKITPNISVMWFADDGDPLADFLASLDRFEGWLDDDLLVLPGHRRPFTGATARIGQLRGFHQDRLNDALEACRGQARTAFDLLPTLFNREMDLNQIVFAIGEAIAHMRWLERRGHVEAASRADGAITYRATSQAIRLEAA